jgi:dienelactone hydrolase
MKKLRFATVLAACTFMLVACNGSYTSTQVPTALPTSTISPPVTASPEPPTQTPMSPTSTPLPDYNELARLFEYDKSSPLNVNWGRQEQKGAVVSIWGNYLGAEGCEVNAILVRPTGIGPYPAVIYMHMGQATKLQYRDEAIALAEHGVVSLLLDSPFVSGCFYMSQARAGYIATVIDVRRGLDLLETISAVDPKQIGYVGHSFGATWGGVLAGVESRITAYVLMAGDAQTSATGAPDTSGLDAILYIGHNVTAPVLFQFSSRDEYISEADALQYYQAAQSPKKILWYDSTHAGLRESGQADRLIWLSEQLHFVYP